MGTCHGQRLLRLQPGCAADGQGAPAQGEGTGRAVKLARMINAPLYVVHVMSKDALHEIERGLQAGQRLFGEAVVGALALTDEVWCARQPAWM